MKYLIKERREAIGMTQRKLAEALHITPTALNNWENGVAEPRAKMLPALARALKCKHIDELYPEETRP